VRIQEVSSWCPQYPVQWTRYNSLQGTMLVVNLGVEDFGDFEFQLVIDNNRWGWGCVMSHNTPVTLLTNFPASSRSHCHSHLHSEISRNLCFALELGCTPSEATHLHVTLLPDLPDHGRLSTPDPVSCYSISLTLLFLSDSAFPVFPFMYHPSSLTLYMAVILASPTPI